MSRPFRDSLTGCGALALASTLACLEPAPPSGPVLCTSDDVCAAGERCDPVAHVCTQPGQEPARITEVVFEPAVTSSEAELVIRADRALSDEPAVLTIEPQLTPTFSATDETEQRFLFEVADVEEGRYLVRAIEVTDAAGRRVHHDGGAVLTVDRTQPQLLGLEVVTGADTLYSDLDGSNRIAVRFLANEPVALDGCQLMLQGIDASDNCAAELDGNDEPTDYTICTVTVTSAVQDGALSPQLEIADVADNEDLITLPPLRVDTRVPAPLGAVQVLARVGATIVEQANAESVVTVSFSTELLQASPVVTAHGLPTEEPLVLTLTGRVVEGEVEAFTFELARPLTDATALELRATLIDRVGHESAVILGAVPYGFGACQAPPGQSCVDTDGDGHAARGACPEGDDDDDGNALAHPGALEIPGNGIDEDQLLGDLPIDETTGVFFDAALGDDTNPGTRAAPKRTLDLAAIPDGQFAYLAAGDAPYVGGVVGAGIVGGLDPTAGWARTPGRSVLGALEAPAGLASAQQADALIVGVEAPLLQVADINNIDVTIADAAFDTLDSAALSGRLVVVRVTAQSADFDGGGTVALTSCDLGYLDHSAQGVLLRSIVREGISLRGGSHVVVVNSAVFGVGRPAVHMTAGSRAALFHSTLSAAAGAPLVLDGLTATGSHVTLVGALLSSLAAPVIDIRAPSAPDQPAPITLIGNLLAGPVPLHELDDGVNADRDRTYVEACSFLGCVAESGNVFADDAGFATLFHLDADSPARDGAVVATDFGAPTSVTADFDLDCRYADDAPDFGADEVP